MHRFTWVNSRDTAARTALPGCCYNVSMPSHWSAAPRRIPQQNRGRRRVAGFLRAAAAVITEAGYERATMSAIAERAGSCIGSLYQFFPNKLSVAEALRAQYIEDVEQRWTALAREAPRLSARHLVRRLVELQAQIAQSHPVVLALLDVPPTSHTTKRRQLVRNWIAAVLVAHRRRMSDAAALRVASVVQQVSRALLALYAQAGPDERLVMMEEFKAVLSSYLLPKLGPRARRPRRLVSAGDARRTSRALSGAGEPTRRRRAD